MSDNSETQITANVLQSLAGATSPRLKQVMTSLITHLHTCIREVELTEAEWLQAIQFLTRTGQLCDDRRQEFILLSDTLGVSMLVDAINHRADGPATASTVLGPFYREVLDTYDDWARLREVSEHGCVLVRPDAHVAWRSHALPDDCTQELRKALGLILGLETV